ncbi:MAG: hypothetical protein HYV26_09290 [Candidatus Hydrogenedentes bacterium]|nr:hypothetical protein [Candidatus Hydrogenedentota bacterium]
MSAAQTALHTTSLLKAWILCNCFGYHIETRWCTPRLVLFGKIMYHTEWVLAPSRQLVPIPVAA